DLSYNELSGRFPAWVSQNNLKLNLVANKFVIDATNYSKMPRGLGCLQQHNPCNHGTPIHSSFAVKCGGNSETINGIEYDADVQDLSVAAYYVTDTWAVSNTGYNPAQIKSVDSEYMARGSLSSLRYYGLGLENGCYSITLEFPEITYKSKQTWRALERRIFDIYIQGDLAAKDFNLRKEAGGLSNGPIVRKYIANVTDNLLEIHLFWSGKGTCCIPEEGSYGPLISSIYIVPWDLSQKKSHIGLYAGIVAGALALALSIISGILLWINKKKRLNTDEYEVSGFSAMVDTFSYAELKTATDGFNSSNKLGEGGFGPVFKGVLADGRPVAVKQLSRGIEQGKMEFLTEIATISSVQHRNLVKLYGYCAKRDWRFLVYEYLEYNSLDQALFGKSGIQLDWNSRFGICLGTARGLAYLHGESTVRIIHRDVKSSNILIDADLKPKISDFGLAKLYDDNKTHLSTRVAGTVGYLAPEYAMTGHLTEKVDVFGFGVVVLEVLSGKRSSSSNSAAQKVFLLEWAWHLHEKNCELEIVDPNLSSYNEEEAIRLFHIALLCTQMSPMLRPSMSRALAMLAGDVPVPEIAASPGYYMTNLQAGGSSDCTSIEFSNSMMAAPSNGLESNKYSCKSVMMGTSSSQTSTSPDSSLGSVPPYFTSSSHPLL
ncbi:hypothetical protein Taro_043463, partial [Colocasia esculenta]|nr:hypothetical protein [Colocasia esculenta]